MTPAEAAPSALREIPLEQLRESPLNHRRIYDAAKLEELKASIQASGILTPLTVRPSPNGKGVGYEIGAGHRRYRAAKLAGLASVPAFVRPMDDRTFLELLTVENLQRDDLHPLEEAEGYVALMKTAGYDVARIAERVGRSVKYVYDRIKLLQLTKLAQKLFLEGKFTAGHAILLARLSPKDQARALDAEDERWGQVGGLFQDEHAEPDPHAPAQEKLALEDARKPVSVREFETWINDHVRQAPETLDSFLFPESAQLLQAAAAEKRKLVHITYDYRVPDDARDPKIRTYGENGWKRADGKFGSKVCAHRQPGLVVAGPGRGEAFEVCVKKDKCAVHWSDWMKERARRQKEEASYARKADRTGAAPETDHYAAQERREKAEAARWTKAAPAMHKAILEAVKKASASATGPLASVILEALALDRPSKDLSLGRSAEDLVRYAAFNLADGSLDVTDYPYGSEQALRTGKALGVDLKKILDQAAPIAKSEPKKAPAPKKTKGPSKK